MAVNADTVVVDVQARLTNLDRGLVEGQRKIDRFAVDAELQGARVDRAFDRVRPGRAAADKLLGDVRTLRTEADNLMEQAVRVDESSATAGASLGRLAVGAGVAAVGVNVLGNNLAELGAEGKRVDSAFSNLTSGNFVGFWKDVRSEVGPTKQELLAVGDAAKLTNIANQAAAGGFDKLAASARQAASSLRAAERAASDYSAIRDPIRGGALDAQVSGVPLPDPLVGLSQRLQTAIAAARSTPGVKDDVAQLRRGAAALQKQLGQGDITDADREQIYAAIAAINGEITTLTASPSNVKTEPPLVPLGLDQNLARAGLTKGIADDIAALRAIDAYLVKKIAIETDQNRKLSELQRLGQVRAQLASLTNTTVAQASVTDLFQGPTLTSRPFQFAQQFGFKADAATLLKDVRGQVAQAKAFAANLKRLAGKGASQDLISTLAGQGSDQAGAQVAALAGADRGLVKQYSGAFTTRQRQEQQLANLTANVQTATINVGSAVVAGRGPGGRMKFETSGLAGAR